MLDLGPGRPLPPHHQRRLEIGLGRPVGPVSLHTGPAAVVATGRLGASGLNVGRSIAFGDRSPPPGTFEGDLLLAHELAHVVQRAETRDVSLKAIGPAAARDDVEREADLAAALTVARMGGHERAIEQATGLTARQQQALRPAPANLGRASGLRLSSCVEPEPAQWAPDIERFRSITQQLNALYGRLTAIREGRLPLTAREEVDQQIDLLTGELAARFGVRLTPDQLRDALSADPRALDHLLTDLGAEISVTPPAPHRMLQRLDFELRLGLVPPDAPLDVEWRWTVGKGEYRFLVLGEAMAARSGAMHVQLDDPFWNVLPPDIAQAGGLQVLAKVYLRGATQPLAVARTPFLRLDPALPGSQAVGIRSEVIRGREPIATDKAVVGTDLQFRVADWVPPYDTYEIEWEADGTRLPGPNPTPRHRFSTVGDHQVSLAVWRRGEPRTLVGRAKKTITVVQPGTVAEPAFTVMAERGVSGLTEVRSSMTTAITHLETLAGEGKPRAEYYRQSLKAQKQAAAKVDEFTRPALGTRPLSAAQPVPADLSQMQEGQAYTGPIQAVLVVHATAEAQPLAMHLLTWHEPASTTTVDTEVGPVEVELPPQWHARLIDLTGAHVVKFDGRGSTPLAATTAAFRDWRDDNTYPQKCTVVHRFNPPGWSFPLEFSTSTTEKQVLEWIDGILAVGGILVAGLLLLVPEPTMATKALGLAILAATVARSAYAIAEYRDLGYDWTSREIALEGVSIVTAFMGLGGGLLRSAGRAAARPLVMQTGKALVLASTLADVGSVVFLAYDGYQQLKALEQDPTLNESQREMATIRLISGLLLQGVMLVVSNKELLTRRLGRNAKFTDRFGDPSRLVPEGHSRLDMELALMEAGVARTDLPRDPQRLTQLFLSYQQHQQAAAALTHIREQLPPDRRAAFDAERAKWDHPEDFLDHLTEGGTKDPKTSFEPPTDEPAVGGTRGATSYKKSTGASSPGSLYSKTLDKRFGAAAPATTRERMHGASLQGLQGPAAGSSTSTAVLAVPMPDGSTKNVTVRFHSTGAAGLPRGPHGRGGGESGPARMKVTELAGGGYEADVYVDRDLHPTDAGDAVGHELDELAGLVHGGFAGEALGQQQRAGLLRPSTAKRPPAPTVHDRAQARELKAAWERTSGPPEQRLKALSDKLQGWGLADPAHTQAKMDFLRQQGVPEELVRALHADL
jgi:hypothetical protein